MGGDRSEPVEVWEVDGRPGRFVWRERLYTVLAVLERPSAEPAVATWRCWRVTASPGKNVPGGTFRICQNVMTGRWRLSRQG